MEDRYNEQLLEEIEEIIDINKESSDKKTVPIIFDGKQFTVKIPKKIANRVLIDEKNEFEFRTSTRFIDGVQETKLEGRLVKGGKKNTS